MDVSEQAARTQTQQTPMTTVEEVLDYVGGIRSFVSWDRAGVLCDEGPANMVVLLLRGDEAVIALRFCLSPDDSVEALRACGATTSAELRHWQGGKMTTEQLGVLGELTELWQRTMDQTADLSLEEWRTHFADLGEQAREKGRASHLSAATRNQVLLDSHGRCMFDGCGADLTIDPLTGQSGNFAALAHNVAASQRGPRGIPALSTRLGNEPSNILLLCDTHHRLVDNVARADYPAGKLSAMRRRFQREAATLLDGLALDPIPAYFVGWPVHRQTIGVPSTTEVARSLKPIRARLGGTLQTVAADEGSAFAVGIEDLRRDLPGVIARAADRILMQADGEGFRAALFAMGSMPALIGLGAKLGNKNAIVPMLLFRDNGLWCWPEREPRGQTYDVSGHEEPLGDQPEVCLVLGLTAWPESMKATAESLGLSVIRVGASPATQGSGALGHPHDGLEFRQRMQELLHRLPDRVARVHVLPCASNAACVFFGQAFDNHHPELLIYDFEPGGQRMVPVLRLRSADNGCQISAADVNQAIHKTRGD